MKIIIVAQNLHIGGIQKSLVNLLNSLDFKDFEIDLLTFSDGQLINEVPKEIKIIKSVRGLSLISTSLKSVIKTKKLIDIIYRLFLTFLSRLINPLIIYNYFFSKIILQKEYDVAISFFNDVPRNRFNKGTNHFVRDYIDSNIKIAWIHTDPIKSGFDQNYCLELYSKFNKIACVSLGVKINFVKILPELENKCFVVYNTLNLLEISKTKKTNNLFDNNYINIVSVGRVDNYTKQFNLIPRLLSNVPQNKLKRIRWYIIGNGPDFNSNRNFVENSTFKDIILYIGESENPLQYIKSADYLVLISKFEGFPMVVEEAKALDTFVISLNYNSAKEQITDKKYGIIFEDIEEMGSYFENIEKNIKHNHLEIKMNDGLSQIGVCQFIDLIKRK